MIKLNSLLIIFAFVIFSCKSTTQVSDLKEQQVDQLKKNQFIGVVVLKSMANESRNSQSEKELYFRIGDKDYFIKITEGYIAKDIISKHVDKQILIKGEIKTGEWENPEAGSLKDGIPSKKARSGEYIVINKIFN
jgi:hypothetical protein